MAVELTDIKIRNGDAGDHVTESGGHHDELKGTFDNQAFVPDPDRDVDRERKQEDIKFAETDGDGDNGCSRCVGAIQTSLHDAYSNNKQIVHVVCYIILLLLYLSYFSYAMYFRFDDEGSVRLLVVTIVVAVGLSLNFLLGIYGERLGTSWHNLTNTKAVSNISKRIHILLAVGLSIFVVVYVIVEIALETPRNLISAGGLATLVLIFYVFSVNPAKVKWRPVFWGLMLQFIFALIILRTQGGYDVFEWIGNRVQEFIKYSDKGAEFVFGANYTDHFFAFSVLPVIVFLYVIISQRYIDTKDTCFTNSVGISLQTWTVIGPLLLLMVTLKSSLLDEDTRTLHEYRVIVRNQRLLD
ncbi:solute carrier family 28 member 3-like [Argopecten irradians]|uniref:solute carrier family 28 member 3-like n=1 Tax=Argopecten irradians TaxID=31199 RepID=UPI0037207325